MNKRNLKYWIAGGVFLLIAGILVVGLGMFGMLPWQAGDLYQDPQGRFTMQVDPKWEAVENEGPYTKFLIQNPPMDLYLMVFEAGSVDDAFTQAVATAGFDTGLLSGGNVATIGDWEAYSQTDSDGLMYGLAGQIVGENGFVMMVKTNSPGIEVDNAVVGRALTSIIITGRQEVVIESYADVEAMVQEQIDRLAGSVSIALVHKDETVYTYAYGQANPVAGIPADTRSIFAFGSMTKPFTATALMQLEEQGLVDLDAWPGEYIPEFPAYWNVTVRQLLDHSACLLDDQRRTDGLIAEPGEPFDSLEEIFTAYVEEFPDLVCEPGKVSNYSNSHYLALARIIEEVSGEPYEAYVLDHILTPLEMGSTQFEIDASDARYVKEQYPADLTAGLIAKVNSFPGLVHDDLVLQMGEDFSTLNDYRVLPPWGGLRGTPGDVTHFLQMHMNGGRYGEIQVLKPETVAAMQEMQRSTDGSSLGFGLSWWLNEDDFGAFIAHDGFTAGGENVMRFYPDLDLGVVVMGSVPGYHSGWIAEGLVSAWMHEK